MKKLILVAALLVFLCAGTAFAQFGIGVHGGYGGHGGGGGLNLAFSNIYIYVDAAIGDSNGIGVSGAVDFWQFLGGNIASGFSWYWRLGIPVSLWLGDELGLAAGVRAPIGISWKPINMVEIFLQAVPQISLQILPKIDLWPNFWGGNLGIRFWF